MTSLMAIYDTMHFIKPDVATYCMGQAASAAAVLLAAGAKGKRFALPHSRVMLHQPHIGGLEGQATDIEIQATRDHPGQRRDEPDPGRPHGPAAREDPQSTPTATSG